MKHHYHWTEEQKSCDLELIQALIAIQHSHVCISIGVCVKTMRNLHIE